MNKLEEYRENRFDPILIGLTGNTRQKSIDNYEAMKEGFNVAIALDLPIKFLEWVVDQEGIGQIKPHLTGVWWVALELGERYNLPKHVIAKELFNFWLNNIYGREYE